MSKKIGFLQRWMFIIDKISSYPYITMEELVRAVEEEMNVYDGVDEVGTKTRTIERDLREIRNSPFMDISIEYCRIRKGYYIPQNEKSISKLDRMFELSSLLSFSSLKDIVFVEDRESRGLEHRFGLIGAIRRTKEVIVEYRKYNLSAPIVTYRLQPYALKEYRNRWYLLAIESNSKLKNEAAVKTYGLDRFEKLTITSASFKRDEIIKPNRRFDDCFGIQSNPELEPEKVILSFHPMNGKYHESCPMHKSQRVLISNEKEIRIELTVKITYDFVIELLSQSQGMRVMEPLSLKKKLIEIHQYAIDLLQK